MGLAFEFLGDLLHHGSEGFAAPSPLGGELDERGLVGLEDEALKVGVGYVFHEITPLLETFRFRRGNYTKAMALLLFYALLVLQDSPIPKEFEVEIENDQRYGEAHKKQHLDLYRPKDRNDAPVLMFVHGGAWMSGDRKWYIEFGKKFAKKGLITAVVSYRLSPAVKHPSHIEDVAKAFAWLKKKFASNKIYVMGHSAGGHLVALLTTNEKYLKAEGCAIGDVAGVVGVSGVYHILPDAKMLVEVFTEDPETRKDASPAEFVREGLPRFLLFYASKEMALLDTSAREFHKALEGKKVETQLHEISERDHISIIVKCGGDACEMTKRILEFVR